MRIDKEKMRRVKESWKEEVKEKNKDGRRDGESKKKVSGWINR